MVVRSSSMAVSRDKLFQEALELEQRDRAELAKLLIDSLDPTTEQDVEEAWMREIDRRTAELDAGTVQTIPWDTVRARLRRSARG
jgi:putative addiction module component (TIGR02574 family)